jgi:hypothetical protein
MNMINQQQPPFAQMSDTGAPPESSGGMMQQPGMHPMGGLYQTNFTGSQLAQYQNMV